jgi:hypothetical protein
MTYIHIVFRWTHYALTIVLLLSLISAEGIVAWINMPGNVTLAPLHGGAK